MQLPDGRKQTVKIHFPKFSKRIKLHISLWNYKEKEKGNKSKKYLIIILSVFQQVNYEADHHKGFIADVNYYGEAQYPKYTGPAITFKPSGGYRPAPTYH